MAFGILNVQAPPTREIAAAARPEPGFGALLVLLRDDGDTRRYFAYASAMLGRPYDRFFVRPADEASDTAGGRHEWVTPERLLIPWRDFEVEYPPGVLIAALPPRFVSDDFRIYHFLFGIEMEFLLTLAAALGVAAADRLRPGLGDTTLKLCVVMVAALGVIGARRYDALVALTIAGAVYGLAAKRQAVSGLSLAAAIVAKGAPVLIAPIGALHVFLGDGRRSLGVAAGVAAAALTLAFALYLALAGAHAFDALAYHADRPIQIESPYGAALLIFHFFHRDALQLVHSFGSHNISAAYEPALRKVALVTSLLAVLATYVVHARGMTNACSSMPEADWDRTKLTLACGCAALIAFITLGKVFSPQYLTWLLPLGALSAAMSGERSRVLLIVGIAAAQVEYPFLYQTAGVWVEPLLGLVALIRAGLLVAGAISLVLDAYPRRLGAYGLGEPPRAEIRIGEPSMPNASRKPLIR